MAIKYIAGDDRCGRGNRRGEMGDFFVAQNVRAWPDRSSRKAVGHFFWFFDMSPSFLATCGAQYFIWPVENVVILPYFNLMGSASCPHKAYI